MTFGYLWTLLGCMCGATDPGSCIRWVLGFGIKTGYDNYPSEIVMICLPQARLGIAIGRVIEWHEDSRRPEIHFILRMKTLHFCGMLKSTFSSPSTLMKYEDAMKVLWKRKNHCPQDLESPYDKEIEGFTPASPPRKMATYAPPVYLIPYNDAN
jgi:hypothetical protein